MTVNTKVIPLFVSYIILYCYEFYYTTHLFRTRYYSVIFFTANLINLIDILVIYNNAWCWSDFKYDFNTLFTLFVCLYITIIYICRTFTILLRLLKRNNFTCRIFAVGLLYTKCYMHYNRSYLLFTERSTYQNISGKTKYFNGSASMKLFIRSIYIPYTYTHRNQHS